MAIVLDKAKREIAGVSVSSKETEVMLPENRPLPGREYESVCVPFSENNENNFHRRSQEDSFIRDNNRSQRSFRDKVWK